MKVVIFRCVVSAMLMLALASCNHANPMEVVGDSPQNRAVFASLQEAMDQFACLGPEDAARQPYDARIAKLKNRDKKLKLKLLELREIKVEGDKARAVVLLKTATLRSG